MPDLTWLTDGDRDTKSVAAVVALCLLVVALVVVYALVARLAAPAGRFARWLWRQACRFGRWVARRWDARHAGCPHCQHCLALRRDEARARWSTMPRPPRAAITHYVPAPPNYGEHA